MKKTNGYLKLCNDPFKEKSKKIERRATVFSVITAIIVGIIGLIIVFNNY